MAKQNKHIGSSFKDMLETNGELAEVSALAIKRVIAWELSQKMQNEGISKTAMAEAMNTSRSGLNRVLDPDNTSITLQTLSKAARVVGKQINVELVEIG